MDEILLQENQKVSDEEETHENIESDINENDLYHIDKYESRWHQGKIGIT